MSTDGRTASRGYPRWRIGGLSLLTRSSAGDIVLASYHPRKSLTWYWSISLSHRQSGARSSRAPIRRGQWHDFYRLPFGWQLVWSAQDYHKERSRG